MAWSNVLAFDWTVWTPATVVPLLIWFVKFVFCAVVKCVILFNCCFAVCFAWSNKRVPSKLFLAEFTWFIASVTWSFVLFWPFDLFKISFAACTAFVYAVFLLGVASW